MKLSWCTVSSSLKASFILWFNKFMRSKLLFIAFFLFSLNAASAQTINFRFNNYFYGWQRIDSLSDSPSYRTFHLRGYQNYLLEVNKSNWSFNTLSQTEEDVVSKVEKGFNYRFYNLYVKGTNLFNVLDLKLGRQNIFAGAGIGNIDGIYMKLKAGKYKEFQLAAYGGYNTPDSYELEKLPRLGENYHIGALFTYYGIKDLTASLSYSNKQRKPETYSALRLDSLFDTSTREISFDGPAEQLAGLDLNYTYLGIHNFYSKVYYDIQQKKLYRAELNVRVKLNENIRAFGEYQLREPHFNFNSIFSVFSVSKYQEISGGLDYTLKNGMDLFGKVSAVLYDNDNSVKIQAGMSHPNYGISFIKYLGYAGESDGVSAYYQRNFYDDKFASSASASFSRYRLGNVYATDKINSFSGMLGITYRPVPQISFDAQGQILVNRIYSADTRFLFGFNYWLFKKF